MFLERTISRIFGFIASYKFPDFLQNRINKAYIKAFKIDMSEFGDPDSYKNLLELFTRKLEKKRKINSEQDTFLSPCDGKVLSFGLGTNSTAMSVKGHSYCVFDLLADKDIKEFEYANIYLSPKDYHRYHAPCDMRIRSAFYVPGRLFSVSEKTLSKVSNLYAKNERVILECETGNDGWFYLVFVGAINVAKMRFDFDTRIQTNAKNAVPTKYEYDRLFVKKGEDLGCFELGSTIVIISKKGLIKYNLSQNQEIKFADCIGNINL